MSSRTTIGIFPTMMIAPYLLLFMEIIILDLVHLSSLICGMLHGRQCTIVPKSLDIIFGTINNLTKMCVSWDVVGTF